MNFSKPLMTRFGTILVSGFLLVACSSHPKETIFDHTESTMAEVFAPRQPVFSEVGFSNGDLDGFTRSADRELEQLFPELPNPRLVMYVFPHLTAEGAPIPGYATAFYLYDHGRVFALPGEVAPK